MTFLLSLDPVIFPKEYRSHIKSVFLEFVKRLTIPSVKLKLYVHANMFAVINGLGKLQDD